MKINIVALVSLTFLSAVSASPPPPPPDGAPTALITFPDQTFLRLRSRSGLFPLVATQPAQSLDIQLRFSQSLANTALIVQVLDGGTLPEGEETVTIGADGTATIQFQTGDEAGFYRVLLITGGGLTALQFEAANP